MRKEFIGLMAGALLVGTTHAAWAVQACADPNQCVQVHLGNTSGSAGGMVTVPLTFAQGPDDGAPGGVNETAAIALTIGIPGTGSANSLALADCGTNADGLPNAVKPDASLSNFKVVVENASCANGRTHCLCPDAGSGITPDDFVNLVVYGPNPLPTPGPSGIDIPLLPTGTLLTIDLKIPSAASGSIPLHIFNQVNDTQHPAFSAFLSVGDNKAVDQTCVPSAGVPPCSDAGAVSQVDVGDATVTVTGTACVGDCNDSKDVTVNEIVKLIDIALGNSPASDCAAGDSNHDNQITVDEIIKAVNNALSGCPPS